jgi:peptidylprolyl isomerase
MNRFFVLLALLSLFDEICSQRTPEAKWSQSADRIQLTIKGTKCNQNERKSQEFKYSIKEDDKFSFSCESASGPVSLNFTLREDVEGSSSNCVSDYPKHEDIKCTLRKKHQHTFDRLIDNLEPFKNIITREKVAGADPNAIPPSEQGEPEDYWKNNDLIKNVQTAADYTALLKQEYTLVDVSYPWCSQCGNAKGRFLELINLIQQNQKKLNHTLNFAYIDARHHRQARKYFNPKCDDSCDFFVVRRKERPFRIPYEYEIERLMTKVFAYDKEKVYEIGTTQSHLDNFTSAHSISAVGTFPNRGDYRHEVFARVINLIRGRHLAMGVRFNERVSTASLQVYREFDGNATYQGSWEVENIMKFINHSLVPSFQNYEYELRDDADATGKPHGVFFSPDGEPKHIFDEIIQKFRGRMNFFYVNTSYGNYGNMMEEYGFGHEDTVNPHIGVCSKFALKDAPKYGFTDGHITEENKPKVMQWLELVITKAMNRTYKSAKRPGEFYVGDLNTLVGRTVEEYRNETEFHTLALFYKFHQDYTEEMRHELRRFARMLKKNEIDRLFIASMETVRNTFNLQLFCDLDEEHSAPVVLLMGSGKCIKYNLRRNDEVNIPLVLQFLKKHVPCIRESWDQMQKEIDTIKASELAKLKAMEERKKAFEDKLDGYEKVKLAKGVVKYIKVRGEAGGASPYEGSDVTCHFVLYLHSDLRKVESSYENGQIFRFKMGAGGVVKCFDEAFASMVPGEKSIIFCPSDMAYNTYGTDKIPVNADLYYDIHLISFDEVKSEL